MSVIAVLAFLGTSLRFAGDHVRRATSNGFIHSDVASVDSVAGSEQACIWGMKFDVSSLLAATRLRLATKLYSCVVRSTNTQARVKFRELQRQDSAHKRVANEVFAKPGAISTWMVPCVSIVMPRSQ